jgi:hypothetical protein
MRVAARDGLGEVRVVVAADRVALAVAAPGRPTYRPARRPERDVDGWAQATPARHRIDAVERAPGSRGIGPRVAGVEVGPLGGARVGRDLRPAGGHADPVHAELAQVVQRGRDPLRRAVQQLGVVLHDRHDRRLARRSALPAAAGDQDGQRDRCCRHRCAHENRHWP